MRLNIIEKIQKKILRNETVKLDRKVQEFLGIDLQKLVQETRESIRSYYQELVSLGNQPRKDIFKDKSGYFDYKKK